MKFWWKSATVWINDPEKRKVVVGPYGFVWWKGPKVFIGRFDGRQEQPVSAYNTFEDGEILEYTKKTAPRSAVMRFVRTGLLPG